MWTKQEILALKNSSAKWKIVIPEIIQKLLSSDEDYSDLINSFQQHVEDRKEFSRQIIMGILDFNQKNLKDNTLIYNFLSLCDLLPITEENSKKMSANVNGNDNQIYQSINNTTIINNVSTSVNVNTVLRNYELFIENTQDFHSLIRVSKKVFSDQKSIAVIENLERYWNPSVEITVYKKQINSLLYGKKQDANFMKEIYDNVAIIQKQINLEMENVTKEKIDQDDLIDKIIYVYKQYVKFWKENLIVFPDISSEVKKVADEILSNVELSVTSNDLNEVKKIQSSLAEYMEVLNSFKLKAEQSLESADNDEKNVILELLSDVTPKWSKFKEAYKVLKTMKLDLKDGFPETEPTTDIKKRLLKQEFFGLIGR